MADIMSGFSSFISMAGVIKMLVWFGIALVIGLAIAMIIVFVLVQKKTKKVYVINLVNKKLQIFSGREKKTKSGIRNFFVKKIGRFFPIVQEDYKWTRKNNEIIPLIMDNNGLFHTLKLPDLKEIQRWYMVQYGIDMQDPNSLQRLKERQQEFGEIHNIYALPNPHENLEWLGNQCVEADQEFKYQSWWQSPSVLMLGTLFICFITFVVTMIVSKRI